MPRFSPSSFGCAPSAIGSSQQGSTLIEVMVSIIVLSLGLLGIAGLQAATTKYKINTWSRSAATQLVSELSERIRINPDMAGSNFTTGVTEASTYSLKSSWSSQAAAPPTITKNCDEPGTGCTSAERAAYDMAVWRQRVRSSMPQGSAFVTGDKAKGFQVTLMWMDNGATDKGRAADSQLVKPAICEGTETGMAQQTCCPTEAGVANVAGVRCARFTFVP